MCVCVTQTQVALYFKSEKFAEWRCFYPHVFHCISTAIWLTSSMHEYQEISKNNVKPHHWTKRSKWLTDAGVYRGPLLKWSILGSLIKWKTTSNVWISPPPPPPPLRPTTPSKSQFPRWTCRPCFFFFFFVFKCVNSTNKNKKQKKNVFLSLKKGSSQSRGSQMSPWRERVPYLRDNRWLPDQTT